MMTHIPSYPPLEISIIVPVYNAEVTLCRCVDSVLNQTFRNFELILINDGSTDKSMELCDRYASDNISVFTIHQTNRGVSSARNKGIEHAQGKYICFVDSDDWLEPGYLEAFMSNEIAGDINSFIYQDMMVDSSNSSVAKINLPGKLFTKSHFSEAICEYELIHFSNPFGKLFHSSIIKKHSIRFNPDLHYAEDLIFILEYLFYIEIILFVDRALYHWVIGNSDSLSYRNYPYETELKSFQLQKKYFQQLAEKWDLNDESVSVFYERLGFTLVRVLTSLHLPEYKKKKSERFALLKMLATTQNKNYLHEFVKTSPSIYNRISCKLFLKGLLSPYDYFQLFRFSLRQQKYNTLKKKCN